MKSYELKHISDLLKIPADRRDAALDELKLALPFYAAQLVALQQQQPDATYADILPKLIWEDNGETTVTARYGNGFVATLTHKQTGKNVPCSVSDGPRSVNIKSSMYTLDAPRMNDEVQLKVNSWPHAKRVIEVMDDSCRVTGGKIHKLAELDALTRVMPPMYRYSSAIDFQKPLEIDDLVQLSDATQRWPAPRRITDVSYNPPRCYSYAVDNSGVEYDAASLYVVNTLRRPMPGDMVLLDSDRDTPLQLIDVHAYGNYVLSDGKTYSSTDFTVIDV